MDNEQEAGTDLETADYTEPENPSGGGLGEILTRKYGPLPVWAYGVVIGGVLLVFFAMRGRGRPDPQAGAISSPGSFPVSSDIPSSGNGGGGDGNRKLLEEILDLLKTDGTQPSGDLSNWITKLKDATARLSVVTTQIARLQAGTILNTKHYTVKEGDTLASIAAHFSINVSQILQANPNKFNNEDPTKVRSGMVGTSIKIPIMEVDHEKLVAKQAEYDTLTALIKKLEDKITGAT